MEFLVDQLLECFLFISPRRIDDAVFVLNTSDKGLHRIVILLSNWIEFMIVTTSATDTQAQKGLADVDHDFIDSVLSCKSFARFIGTNLSREQHRCGDQKTRRGVLSKSVSSDLLTYELLEGQIVIKGLNHIVAIVPGVWSFRVDLKSMGICIAHYVEPMLSPTLRIPR